MTNHEAVAPMSTGDRRIVTFDVSNRYARNREYFGKMLKEIHNGGSEGFVYDMLNRDISEFNISKIPNSTHSESAINSIMNTADDWLRWFHECLLDNEIKGLEINPMVEQTIGKWSSLEDECTFGRICKVNSGGAIPTKVLYDSYKLWGNGKSDLTVNKFSRNMKRILIKYNVRNNPTLDQKEINNMVLRKVRFGKTLSNCLMFKSLTESRKAFAIFINKVIEWEDVKIISEEELEREIGKG